jgi:histidinol-phosphatase
VIGDLELAQRAALAGARLGRSYFARVRALPQELKADGSVVAEADRAVEHEVRRVLMEARPGDAFLGEETGEHGRGRRRWILDGIDGTAVFVTGDRRRQTLIALEEDGEITVGVAVLPARSQMWWARRTAADPPATKSAAGRTSRVAQKRPDAPVSSAVAHDPAWAENHATHRRCQGVSTARWW